MLSSLSEIISIELLFVCIRLLLADDDDEEEDDEEEEEEVAAAVFEDEDVLPV